MAGDNQGSVEGAVEGGKMTNSGHGGQRPNQTGRPKVAQKRVSISIVVDAGTKPLALLIADKRGLGAWGHLVDDLVRQEASRLGIVTK